MLFVSVVVSRVSSSVVVTSVSRDCSADRSSASAASSERVAQIVSICSCEALSMSSISDNRARTSDESSGGEYLF